VHRLIDLAEVIQCVHRSPVGFRHPGELDQACHLERDDTVRAGEEQRLLQVPTGGGPVTLQAFHFPAELQ
jgi:hypothetical protein